MKERYFDVSEDSEFDTPRDSTPPPNSPDSVFLQSAFQSFEKQMNGNIIFFFYFFQTNVVTGAKVLLLLTITVTDNLK